MFIQCIQTSCEFISNISNCKALELPQMLAFDSEWVREVEMREHERPQSGETLHRIIPTAFLLFMSRFHINFRFLDKHTIRKSHPHLQYLRFRYLFWFCSKHFCFLFTISEYTNISVCSFFLFPYLSFFARVSNHSALRNKAHKSQIKRTRGSKKHIKMWDHLECSHSINGSFARDCRCQLKAPNAKPTRKFQLELNTCTYATYSRSYRSNFNCDDINFPKR